jgi:hypothetical protein
LSLLSNTTLGTEFLGELYIDKRRFNPASANFRFGVNDRDKSAKVFVKKKSTGTNIWPTKANYQIDCAPEGDSLATAIWKS